MRWTIPPSSVIIGGLWPTIDGHFHQEFYFSSYSVCLLSRAGGGPGPGTWCEYFIVNGDQYSHLSCIPWILHHYLSSHIIIYLIRSVCQKVFNRSSENQIAIHIVLTRHQQTRVLNALLSSNASFPWPCCMSRGAWLVIWIFHAWRDDERPRSSME